MTATSRYSYYFIFECQYNEVHQSLKNEILRILFMGLRRQKAAKLRWNQVNLKAKTLKITNTKNNETHSIPLSKYQHNLLLARKKNSASDYVFPGTGDGGYIIEPRKQIAKVVTALGIQLSIHDCAEHLSQLQKALIYLLIH